MRSAAIAGAVFSTMPRSTVIHRHRRACGRRGARAVREARQSSSSSSPRRPSPDPNDPTQRKEHTKAASNKSAFIFLGAGQQDPAVDRAVIERGGLTKTIVAVPDPSRAAAVARELVTDGAQSIELCGALGPASVAEVLQATGGQIPVGGVTYGMESVHHVAALSPGQRPRKVKEGAVALVSPTPDASGSYGGDRGGATDA
jgi:hypothetical protein